MTYSYEFTEPALKQFQQLEPWLAEETLDELETLAVVSPTAHRRLTNRFVHDFVRIRGASTLYVFLTIVRDRANQKLRVMDVGTYVRGVSDEP